MHSSHEAMRSAAPRWLSLVVAAWSVTLTSCGATPTNPSVPEGAAAGDMVLEPCAFETEGGVVDADCGMLVVPENRAGAAPHLIALPVIRVRATADDPGEPIFFLEGGPGQSNMGARPPAELLAAHDLLMVGYRGIDGSSVLECPEVSQSVRGVEGDALGASSLARTGAAYRQCAERLQGAGVDLDGYTMPEVVADLEDARAALGYERVNLLSHSYGTRIAQIYAHLHPDRVHRSAMIGANPPGRFVWEPETVDAGLEHYARLCAQDPGCRARTPDLAETMRTVVRDMPRRWLLVPIDPGKVRVTTFVMLFHRQTAAMVFDAYIAAERGDPSGLALMSLAYDLVVPSSSNWGDSAAKAISADFDPARDYVTDMDPPDSILGAPLSMALWGPAQHAEWPTAPIPAALRQVQASDVETLLVSGSADFSTPAELATTELLPHLSRGRQVVLAEMGHVDDVWRVQPAATTHLLATFYATGTGDDSLFIYAPMDFDVRMGFPLLAKVAFGVVLLLVAAVVGLGWFVRQRVRRRRPASTTGRGRGGADVS